MKAIGYTTALEISDPNALLDIELDTPEATGKDLLVRVAAISVNPVDTKIRGNVAPEGDTPKVIGWDAVGEVVAVGEQVENFQAGDRVWYAGDLTRQGSNAEYQLVDERIAALAPATLSDAEAAAIPLTAITAWELLFDRLGFTPNQDASSRSANVLVIGAAGGVGSILVQLAKQLTHATVIGTASRDESAAWVTARGADHVINHRQPLAPQLEALGIDAVSHVISLTHTSDYFDQIVEVLKPQGQLALIDEVGSEVDIMKLKMKSISLHWEFMFTRAMFTTDDMNEQHHLLHRVAQLVDKGALKTTLGTHFGKINAENLTKAHSAIESGQTVGKIVLEGF